ncbi:MAG TPA: cytochrome c oxidase assembly protein, partial [Thermoanaerobaculia bacterium]|nr:cytochrome c oxidase assembly protein [Thermoanaerobaculia bacterium]
EPPVAAWIAFALALWVWHVPSLYQAALRSETVHAAEHATFLAAALLYWSAVLAGARGRAGVGGEAASLFGTAFHGGLLGALMTIAPTLWYPAYGRGVSATAALEDQQLAGLWMWVPAGLVFVVGGMGLVAGWLRESERRTGGETP